MAPLLVQLNNKPFQKLPGCRASVFAEIDAPALRALPLQTWELAVFKTVKVHIDQHIEFEGHRDSVPHALVGVTLEVRATQRTVEVLHRGQRVASHMRCAHKGGFTTVAEHLSAAHRAHMQWSPERLIHWGQDIGVATGSLVAHTQTLPVHGEGKERRTGGLTRLGAVGQAHIGQATGGLKVRVVKQFFGFDNRCKGEPCFFENRGQLGGGESFQAAAQLGQQLGTQGHACVVVAVSGLIRVDADEVTYPAHIMLRYDIERRLIEGDIEAADIPSLWDAQMSSLLDLDTRGNFKDGPLQDVHWPMGLFGYFPCYSMGAMYAAQWFASIEKAIPNVHNDIQNGNLQPIWEWLNENIWQKASFWPTDELAQQASGSELDLRYFKRHLYKRYLGETL